MSPTFRITPIANADLSHRLWHIYGPQGAGKSTVARAIANQRFVINLEDHEVEHHRWLSGAITDDDLRAMFTTARVIVTTREDPPLGPLPAGDLQIAVGVLQSAQPLYGAPNEIEGV